MKKHYYIVECESGRFAYMTPPKRVCTYENGIQTDKIEYFTSLKEARESLTMHKFSASRLTKENKIYWIDWEWVE